jgi:hypothetical protein
MIIKVKHSLGDNLRHLPEQEVEAVYIYIGGEEFRIKEDERGLYLATDGQLKVAPVSSNAVICVGAW